MKKVFITGATGFLGSYLAKLLVQKGEEVHALKRKNSPMNLVQSVSDQLIWHEGDVNDMGSLHEAMSGCQQVYHTAAIVSFNPKDREKLFKVNIEGTENVVNTALELGIEKLLHISSIASLGRTKTTTHIDETNSWEDDPLNTNYAISKFKAECEVWRAQEEGLNTVILNPSLIMGTGFWDRGTARIFANVYQGLKYYPTGGNGYVGAVDVARASYELMNSPITGERFIVNAANWSHQEALTKIAKALGKNSPSIAATPFLLGLAWRLDWLKSKISGKEAFLSRETAKTSSHRFYYDSSKLQKAIGFEYTPMDIILQNTANDFLKWKNKI